MRRASFEADDVLDAEVVVERCKLKGDYDDGEARRDANQETQARR
jgi:hypothetical protein